MLFCFCRRAVRLLPHLPARREEAPEGGQQGATTNRVFDDSLYVCKHVYIYIYIYVYVYIYIYTHIHVRLHISLSLSLSLSLYIYIYMRVCVYTHICIHMCICIYKQCRVSVIVATSSAVMLFTQTSAYLFGSSGMWCLSMWGLKVIAYWPSTTEGVGTWHLKVIWVRR